jgi:hypothetical protein
MGRMRAFRFGVLFVSFVLVTVLASPFASPALAVGSNDLLSGCTGQYYNNTTLSGSPVLVRTDPVINFSWPAGTSPGAGVATSQYSVSWTCSVNVATAGTYTINMWTDDGMNILVDGNLVTWAWYDQGPTTYSNSVYLNAGAHTVLVQYYNNTGGGTAQVSTNIVGSTLYYGLPAAPAVSYYVPPPPAPVPYSGYYLPYPPAPPPIAGNFLLNCTGEYFNNITLSGSPVFVRTDGTLNFYWHEGTSPGAGINTTNYSIRWTCPVNVASSGTYAFSILSDDGMNVWVDGSLVIGAWYDQPPAFYSNSIYLNAGAHNVVVQYYNRTRGGTVQVTSSFASSGVYYAPSSPAVVSAPYSNGLLSGCTGQYYNNTTLAGSPAMVRADGTINFAWPQGSSPGPGVTIDHFSVLWTCPINVATAGTYTVSMLTDDGMNVLVDGNLVTWAWYDQGPTYYSNPVTISAGAHTILVQYYNATLGGTAQVSLR